jgi:hypothetical protein
MIIRIVNFHTLCNAVVQKDKGFAETVDPENLLNTHKEGTRRMKELKQELERLYHLNLS